MTEAGPLVVVFDPIPGDWSFEPERSILGARGVDLVVPESRGEADEAIRCADVVVVTGIRRLDAERVASLQDPAGILCYSIGMDKVDPSAGEAGISVRNVPDYCTDEVSDHALALLLAAGRRLVPIANLTAGQWKLSDRSPLAPIRRLRGQTLGVVGAGRVGRLVARKARAFGYRTIAHDPLLADAGDPELELVRVRRAPPPGRRDRPVRRADRGVARPDRAGGPRAGQARARPRERRAGRPDR